VLRLVEVVDLVENLPSNVPAGFVLELRVLIRVNESSW